MHPAAGRQFPEGPRCHAARLGESLDHAHVIISVDEQRIHPPTHGSGDADHDQQCDAAERINASGRAVFNFIWRIHVILLHQSV